VTALRGGVCLDYSSDPRRPEFRVTSEQRSLLAPLLAEDVKPELRRVLGLVAEYRAILLQIFTLAAAGATASRGEGRAAIETEIRLHDELGPELAKLILAAAEREYSESTGLCAYCRGLH